MDFCLVLPSLRWPITMAQDNEPDLQVEGWLKTLGIVSLCQWDVLVFQYRHQSSLVSAEDISRFLGYATAEVVAAYNSLESSGLVERSRVSQGVRLYQVTASADHCCQHDSLA